MMMEKLFDQGGSPEVAQLRRDVMEIVKTKAKDLNSRNDEAGFRVIAGTARQMGLEIVD